MAFRISPRDDSAIRDIVSLVKLTGVVVFFSRSYIRVNVRFMADNVIGLNLVNREKGLITLLLVR